MLDHGESIRQRKLFSTQDLQEKKFYNFGPELLCVAIIFITVFNAQQVFLNLCGLTAQRHRVGIKDCSFTNFYQLNKCKISKIYHNNFYSLYYCYTVKTVKKQEIVANIK